MVAVLAAVVIALAVGLAPQLFAICQDEEFARVSGLPVRLYSMLIAVMAAVTVTVAMRTVGLLLVSALMVVPVATAQQLTRSFRTTFALAMVLGVVPSLGGVVFSYYVDVAPGASIVVGSLLGFVLAWPAGSLLRRRRARRSVNGEDPRVTGRTSPPSGTRTSTTPSAATPPSSTATTPTTSTTATCTPRTAATTTNTDAQGLRQTDTWLSLPDVNGLRSQSAQRSSSSSPASCAIRSHSDGQT